MMVALMAQIVTIVRRVPGFAGASVFTAERPWRLP